jgi:hypothetical protein
LSLKINGRNRVSYVPWLWRSLWHRLNYNFENCYWLPEVETFVSYFT